MTPVLIPGTFICDSFFLAELWEKLYLVQRGRDLHIFRLSNRNLPRVNKPTYKPRHQPWLCHPRNLFIRFLCIIWIFFLSYHILFCCLTQSLSRSRCYWGFRGSSLKLVREFPTLYVFFPENFISWGGSNQIGFAGKFLLLIWQCWSCCCCAL